MADTTTLPRPDAIDVEQVENNLAHYVCDIHEDVALCGANLEDAGEPFLDDTPPGCPLCVLAWESGVECAIPGCPGQLPGDRRG